MAYAILRVAKLKTMGNVGGQSSHVERLRETLNADPARIELNQRLAGTDSPLHDVQERLAAAGIEPRKGAVVAIDVFITASPEHFKTNHPDDPNWQAFQAKAMQFLQREYGRHNVVHAIAHHDETSPHLHAIVVPIKSKTVKVGRKVKAERTENRLCCRDWLGGDRTTLSKLQTRFADQVKELGLHRGIAGSQAKHTKVSQFYTVMAETTAQAQHVNTQLAPISPDYYVRAVPKPGLLDMAQPRRFAQAQVAWSLQQVASQIEQTNANAQAARRGQLVGLQTPVTNALNEKGQTRQSQAEAALLTLGYRLDQHGQLINVLEERKAALRATISASVPRCTTLDELHAALAKKGVKMALYKDQFEESGSQRYRQVAFDDGKGERIGGHELGPDYMTVALLRQLRQVADERALKERQKQHAQHYDQILAKAFKEYRGDARKTADYLQALSQPVREELYQGVTEQFGTEAGDYIRHRLETDRQKTPLQLSADREHLQKQGFDVGLKGPRHSQGQSIGGP
jgi:predicted metal-dependent hydrolase